MSLKSLLEKNSLNFEDIFYKDCEVFVELLQKWGKVHNLSGRLSDDDIYDNSFFAKITEIDVKIINRLEIEFLMMISF